MRALAAFLIFALVAVPALAQTITPLEAKDHVGQTVTVEGVVAEVHVDARSGVTFVNLGERFPKQPFTGVVFKDDADGFPNVQQLAGKLVAMTGPVQVYKGRIEMILRDPAQLKAK
jgi:DNA/RNA endonuclease YhcR with UshA esterase domain